MACSFERDRSEQFIEGNSMISKSTVEVMQYVFGFRSGGNTFKHALTCKGNPMTVSTGGRYHKAAEELERHGLVIIEAGAIEGTRMVKAASNPEDFAPKNDVQKLEAVATAAKKIGPALKWTTIAHSDPENGINPAMKELQTALNELK